ncbi:AraC family transcriptional regulator [Pseudoalteromonas sp. MMG013]|uniref:helix-turn-helix transcriptional regulator n=1 Tax=Pseudoalteromonas sp. MMG013 TaxID=2822687 RepID=UPI001B377E04|nr:AraC family transcriptional regulator [Pseudoalteromonas sp. MMG013]MBQ4861618.1 AraC family transcriptional regulator [Pseudoalteromonas sp. MMG013]
MKKRTEIADFAYASELGGIELLNAQYQKQNFSRHSHEGYTIGVIESGAQQFYRTGGNHIAPQHSIILVNADEVHNGCSATESGWAYQAMYPTPHVFEAISEELGTGRGAPYFPDAVVYDPYLANLLRAMFTTLGESDNRLVRESLIYSSLIKLVVRHSKSLDKGLPLSRANVSLGLVKQFLDEHPDSDVSLRELSGLAGVSACHLLRAFQKQFGLPPHKYQIQARLRMAKRLLRQGRNQLDVALTCGFHDQSHFHRHFKRMMGVTPGHYAKAVASNNVQVIC